jgi:predicted TIM-barrel fold metal-dependent hydrolase
VPYGNPQFAPIFEAAARHRLPVAIHANGGGQPALQTPVGFVHYYLELHSIAEPLAYGAHLTSLICEGTLARLPDLRVVMVEGGFSWLAPLLWRLDAVHEQLRSEAPHLVRRPSEYVYDQVRFTTQPIEEPVRERALIRLFQTIDAARLLLFATDYPHWDYDDPKRALPRLDEESLRRIMSENARELYGLPA